MINTAIISQNEYDNSRIEYGKIIRNQLLQKLIMIYYIKLGMYIAVGNVLIKI